MAKPPQGQPDDKHQVAEFRKAARELGCDDSEEKFRGVSYKGDIARKPWLSPLGMKPVLHLLRVDMQK
jgi:hypothetical protein